MSAWPGGRRGARGAGDTLRLGEICRAEKSEGAGGGREITYPREGEGEHHPASPHLSQEKRPLSATP